MSETCPRCGAASNERYPNIFTCGSFKETPERDSYVSKECGSRQQAAELERLRVEVERRQLGLDAAHELLMLIWTPMKLTDPASDKISLWMDNYHALTTKEPSNGE
jgi:hypothetical protein